MDMAQGKKNLRNSILQRSLELFNDKGVSVITTNHIIEALGISPGTLYYYFPNKEQIVRELFARIAEDFAAILPQDPESFSVADLADLIANIFRLYYKYRFFYLGMGYLLYRDDRLKESYRDNQKQKILFQESFYHHSAIQKFFNRPLKGEELSYILRNFWIVSDNWMSFLFSIQREIDESSVVQGAWHFYYMLKPWLREEMAYELKNQLERALKKYSA